MDKHRQASLARCGAVWLTGTSALTGLLAWVLPDLARARHALAGSGLADQTFEHLLAWLCATVALVGGCWLWAVTTVVTLEAARGRTHPRVPGIPLALRRVVLAGCGAALVGGLTPPAPATPGQVHQDRTGSAAASVLRGLPLPDRATGALPGDGPMAARVVVVRPGDTLWDLAARDLAADAGDADVAERWHQIYELNRDVIGADPDTIHPAQRLRLPHA